MYIHWATCPTCGQCKCKWLSQLKDFIKITITNTYKCEKGHKFKETMKTP